MTLFPVNPKNLNEHSFAGFCVMMVAVSECSGPSTLCRIRSASWLSGSARLWRTRPWRDIPRQVVEDVRCIAVFMVDYAVFRDLRGDAGRLRQGQDQVVEMVTADDKTMGNRRKR
jgi:hypothetical protein